MTMLGATAALALAFSGGPARGDGLYLKGSAGISQGIESDLSGANVVDGRANFDIGAAATAAIGLQASALRFELEGGFTYAPLGSLDATSITTPIGTFTNISGVDGAGNVKVYTAMLSAYVDIPVGWPQLTPYIGGGGGLAYVEADNLEGVIGGAHFAVSNSNDLLPAVQGEAGLVYQFQPQLAMELSYRYLRGLKDARLDDAVGGSFTAGIAQHLVRIALRVYL